MKKQGIISLLILFFFSITNVLISVPVASAQGITVLGEIKTTGSVFIGSSDGQWTASGSSYPLLQDTAIRTEDGSASIYFKDGSRADLSKETMAIVSGSSADYSINLGKGIIAFNISPSASLSVITASTSISVNNRKGLVQKVSYEKQGRVLGVVSVTDKGTEVRSISGRIMVSTSASESKLISSGESIFIGSDNNYRVYKTQAFAGGAGSLWGAAGLGAGFLGAAAYQGNWSSNNGGGPCPGGRRPASPSGFTCP